MNDKKEFVAYLQKKYKDLSEEKLKLLQESGLLEKDYKEFQKSKKLKALHGAKLDYIKSLKNQCAEDEELYYYKKGGKVGCGCKKKEDGGKVIESALNGAVAKFKSRPIKWTDKDEKKLDSLSTREAKKQPLTPQGKKDLKNLRDKFKKSSNKKDYELEEGKKGMKVEKDCGGAVAKFKAKCGSKLKKHQLGGSLNEIPFYQGGTPKEGIQPRNEWLFDRREQDLGNGHKVMSDWIYQAYRDGRYLGDLSPTVAGRTIYVNPHRNDTVFWRTPDRWTNSTESGGFMPIPDKSKNQSAARNNFYRWARKTTPAGNNTGVYRLSNEARARALRGN